MTVRDTPMVRDQKKFENHCLRGKAGCNYAYLSQPLCTAMQLHIYTEQLLK